MNKWYESVKPGDKVNLDPHWNRTSTGSNRITSPAEVLEVAHGPSQTRTQFAVNDCGGRVRYLDAAWFTGVAK